MTNLPKEITENGIHYILHGDYYFPDFSPKNGDTRPINHWGRMLVSYLKDYKPREYARLLISADLHSLLADISIQAAERREVLIRQMQVAEHVDEALKAEDQWAWVQQMNSIANRADEIIRAELIYA